MVQMQRSLAWALALGTPKLVAKAISALVAMTSQALFM
jgi:hypothetical protein